MKTSMLLLIFTTALFSQTEFYLSTLDFPPSTFQYKATGGLPFKVYSGKAGLFETDSVYMSIEADYPAILSAASTIPAIQDDYAMEDSIIRTMHKMENSAIMTFDNPTDTSIKLVHFDSYELHNRSYNFKTMLQPSLNSYSILFKLAWTAVLAKRLSINSTDTLTDTISAIFKRRDDFDTLKLATIIHIYTSCPNCPTKTVYQSKTYRNVNAFSSSTGRSYYDLCGRPVKRLPAGLDQPRHGALSNGIYPFRVNGRNAKGELVSGKGGIFVTVN
jgi:hypothetical protein